MSIGKFEITLICAAVALLLILRFVVLESSQRHQRHWQELNLFAALNERQELFKSALDLHQLSLKEVEHLEQPNIRKVISLVDRSNLIMRFKKYNEALRDLDEAKSLLAQLQDAEPIAKVPALLDQEYIRIELLRAICYERTKQASKASDTCLSALNRFNEKCLNTKPIDFVGVSRAQELFQLFCKINKGSASLEAAERLFSSLSWTKISHSLSPDAMNKMIEHFADLLHSSRGDENRKKKLLSQLSAELRSEARTDYLDPMEPASQL